MGVKRVSNKAQSGRITVLTVLFHSPLPMHMFITDIKTEEVRVI